MFEVDSVASRVTGNENGMSTFNFVSRDFQTSPLSIGENCQWIQMFLRVAVLIELVYHYLVPQIKKVVQLMNEGAIAEIICVQQFVPFNYSFFQRKYLK